MREESHTNPRAEAREEDEINLLELLRVIVRRRMLIVKICAAAIVLSVCYSLTLKNIYTATSTIMPPPREFGVGGGPGAIAGGAALLAGQNAYLELYVTICKSRTVLDAVIKRLDLQKVFNTSSLAATRGVARGAVKFESGKDGTITVSASNKDPKLAALLANTFVEEMARRSTQLYLSKAGTERSFLEKRLQDVRKELGSAEDSLKSFQEKHKIVRAEAQASAAIEGVARLRLEIINKEVQLAALRNSMTDESSEVKTLQAAIANLKRQLGAMSASGGADSVVPATGNVPGVAIEYGRLFREVKTLEAVFEQLSKQNELAKVNESRDSGTVQVIDEAIPPTQKSRPKRSQIVILSTAIAFFMSIVIIFIQEYFSKLSPENAEIIREIRQSLRFGKRDA